VLALDVVRLRRVKRSAVPFGTVSVRHARIGTSPTVATPTAIGYVHPAVVLPEGFRDRVDEREWNAVLAHECAHLARCDDWAKAFQSAVLRAGWWLPGLWVLSRALDLERELASDERAACETGARRYAACLLRLASARGTDAVAPGFWGRRSHVAIRVERLLRPVGEGSPLVRAAALGAFTALTLAVAVAAVLAVPGTAARTVAVEPPAVRIRTFAAVVRPAARHPRHIARIHRAAPRTVAFVEIAHAQTAHTAVAAAQVPARPRAAAAPRRAEAAAVVPETVAVRAEPPRRVPGRRPAPIRPLVSPEMLAYAATPRRRCPTCFGPLRSPDAAIPAAPSTAFVPPGGGGGGSVSAIAASDPSAGPIDLNSGLVWYRIPARAVQLP
jgi:BlaR1 peptidase M56